MSLGVDMEWWILVLPAIVIGIFIWLAYKQYADDKWLERERIKFRESLDAYSKYAEEHRYEDDGTLY